MADGIQRKFALILNGDPEEQRHFDNVDRAIETLKAEDRDYQIAVLSAQAPAGPVTNYLPPNQKNLETLMAGLRNKMDGDDLLLLYVTGHGDKGDKGEGCVDLPDGCLSNKILSDKLKALSYGRRIVVMDNCYSGGAVELFADEKTEMVTAGSPGEVVSCQDFSPYLWDERVPDLDGDGTVTLVERYRHALQVGKSLTWSNYFSTMPSLSFSGKSATRPPFSPEVVEVTDQKQLKQALRRLEPGQVALVMFSAYYCAPCRQYFPTFQKLGRAFNGQVLLIHANATEARQDHIEEDWGGAWSEYGVQHLPSLSFVDHRGGKVNVPGGYWASPQDFLLVHPVLSLSEQEKLEHFRRLLDDGSFLQNLDQALHDPDPKAKQKIAELLKNFPEEKIPLLVSYLSHFLKGPTPLIRARAAFATLWLKSDAAAQVIPDLLALVKDPDPRVRVVAIGALLVLGRPRFVVTQVVTLGEYTMTTGMITQWPFFLDPLQEELARLRQDKNPEVRRDAVEAKIVSLDEKAKDFPEQVASLYLELMQDPDGENRIFALASALFLLDRFQKYFNLEKIQAMAKTIADHLRKDPRLTEALGELLWVRSDRETSNIPVALVSILWDLQDHSPYLLAVLRKAQEKAKGRHRKLIDILLNQLERRGNYLGVDGLGAFAFGDGGHYQIGAQAGYGYRWNRVFEWRGAGAWTWLSTAPNSAKDYQIRLSTGPAWHWPKSFGNDKFDPYASAQVGFFHRGQEIQNGISLTAGVGLQYYFTDQWLLDGSANFVLDFPFSGKLNPGVQVPLGVAYHF